MEVTSNSTKCLKDLINAWARSDDSSKELKDLTIKDKDITISFNLMDNKKGNPIYLEVFENFENNTRPLEQSYRRWLINKKNRGDKFKIIKKIKKNITYKEKPNKSHVIFFVFYCNY